MNKIVTATVKVLLAFNDDDFGGIAIQLEVLDGRFLDVAHVSEKSMM